MFGYKVRVTHQSDALVCFFLVCFSNGKCFMNNFGVRRLTTKLGFVIIFISVRLRKVERKVHINFLH